MAEPLPAAHNDLGSRDPVFLLMVSGQIQAGEVRGVSSSCWGVCSVASYADTYMYMYVSPWFHYAIAWLDLRLKPYIAYKIKSV